MMNDFPSQIDEFFSALEPEERDKLLAGEGPWKKQTISSGTLIFKEGALSTDLYLILKGRVEVSKRVGKDQLKKVLAVLEPGAIFGEGSLLSDRPRSASVEALEDLEVLILGKIGFDRFVNENSEAAVSLLLGLLRMVNRRLQWTNQELVTLYDVTRIMGEHKDDLRAFIEEISAKLSFATQAERGLIALKNVATGMHEVFGSWGGFCLDFKELMALENSLGNVYILSEKRLVLAIQDFKKEFLGLIVLEQDEEWRVDQKKVALMIAEQLGVAIFDYQFMVSEKGRSKLKQENVQF